MKVNDSVRTVVRLPRKGKSDIVVTIWRFDHLWNDVDVKVSIDGGSFEFTCPVTSLDELGKYIFAVSTLELVAKEEE
jgi:hypothetical protein